MMKFVPVSKKGRRIHPEPPERPAADHYNANLIILEVQDVQEIIFQTFSSHVKKTICFFVFVFHFIK
jgi:hypothetical protein